MWCIAETRIPSRRAESGQRLRHIFPGEREGCGRLSQQERSLGRKAELRRRRFRNGNWCNAFLVGTACLRLWACTREEQQFLWLGVIGQRWSALAARSPSKLPLLYFPPSPPMPPLPLYRFYVALALAFNLIVAPFALCPWLLFQFQFGVVITYD